MLMYIFILLVLVVYFGTKKSEGFGTYDSGLICDSYTQTYLNAVGSGLGTGSVVKNKFKNYIHLEFEVSLPETQSTFTKDNCNCTCNDLFDCVCRNNKGCPKYIVYLEGESSPIKVGKLSKFRDGIFYLKKNIPVTKNKIVVVKYEDSEKIIPVLTGKFSN